MRNFTPTESKHFSADEYFRLTESGYPDPFEIDEESVRFLKAVYDVYECDHCYEVIGVAGKDGDDFVDFWIDFHSKGRHFSWGGTEHFSRLCGECHAELTKPLPPISDRVVTEPENWQPICGGWVLCHIRATDQVFFGPFATLKEADQWLEDVGIDRGVRGYLIPLVSPASNPENIWNAPIREGQIVVVEPELA